MTRGPLDVERARENVEHRSDHWEPTTFAKAPKLFQILLPRDIVCQANTFASTGCSHECTMFPSMSDTYQNRLVCHLADRKHETNEQ